MSQPKFCSEEVLFFYHLEGIWIVQVWSCREGRIYLYPSGNYWCWCTYVLLALADNYSSVHRAHLYAWSTCNFLLGGCCENRPSSYRIDLLIFCWRVCWPQRVIKRFKDLIELGHMETYRSRRQKSRRIYERSGLIIDFCFGLLFIIT